MHYHIMKQSHKWMLILGAVAVGVFVLSKNADICFVGPCDFKDHKDMNKKQFILCYTIRYAIRYDYAIL